MSSTLLLGNNDTYTKYNQVYLMCVCNRTTRSSSLAASGDTDSNPPAASRLGVLSADGDAPCVAETTVVAHLLQSLEVIPPRLVETITVDLLVLAILEVLLPIQKPLGDLELKGVLDDGDETLDLIGSELTRPLAHIDLGLLADKVREPASNTWNGRERKHDLLAAIDIRIKKTKHVLKILSGDERHGCLLCICTCDDKKEARDSVYII